MSTSTRAKGNGTHKAGAFDIRTFIGTLLGIYGVILTLMGLLGWVALRHGVPVWTPLGSDPLAGESLPWR